MTTASPPPPTISPPQPSPSTNPPPFETTEQSEPRPSQTVIAITDAAPPHANQQLSPTVSPIEAPPTYDGPTPLNTTLLCVVRMAFDKQPTFFDTRRPDRLEGKIPFNTYLHRMTELNTHLNTNASLNSMKNLARLRLIGTILFVVCVATALIVNLFTKASYVFALILIPIGYGMLVPMSAQYVSIVEDFALKWTEEDEVLGHNLVYIVKKIQPDRQETRTSLALLIFEKTPTGGGTEVLEELPTYTPA
ncbi:hypothetical protein BCR33DRAFT_857175 [Rhizoclosmatium globosum]|uniref:Uncharacterized protein n=1 Tax=Rhizoclosmatium globosum TaxID=329046 RepID=A0A1Y2B7V3_9FUNG|nr:hypothetical protein BCR33DRAFT_857175 [Rhizoclosmatium globosum]|eukprot:ORY30919.1 hypothetical protein BCR33DRAFT_857175 [Rhizoclosmatium globosum]